MAAVAAGVIHRGRGRGFGVADRSRMTEAAPSCTGGDPGSSGACRRCWLPSYWYCCGNRDHRFAVEAAAKYHRRVSGRFAQHGRHRGRRDARSPSGESPAERFARRPEAFVSTRLYRVDTDHSARFQYRGRSQNVAAHRVHHAPGRQPQAISQETSDLPIGAVVLLTDGDENTGGMSADVISTLRARHIPVAHHRLRTRTRGTRRGTRRCRGRSPRRSRIAHRREDHLPSARLCGTKIDLTVRDTTGHTSTEQGKVLAARTVTLGADAISKPRR